MNAESQNGVLAPDSEALPQEPEFPDGIGIKLEDMAVILAMKHDTVLDKHDPNLIILSICNAFLGETYKLQLKHNEALGKIITSRTQEYVAAVKATTETFSQAVSTASVEGIRSVFERHAASLKASNWNARWCALIAGVSALTHLFLLAGR
jgi:hypothetical protein